MSSIEVVEGPLDGRRLDWIAGLYGAVDPKYAERAFLEHVFVHGPAGPAVHAFAFDDEAAVAHAAVVPTPARLGARPLRAGKLEALVVQEPYRGARGGVSLARSLLERLYERADSEFDVLHAFVQPRVGRTIGFTRLDDVGPPSRVAVLRGAATARTSVIVRALARAQAAPRAVARPAVARAVRRHVVRTLSAGDEDLFELPRLPEGVWAVCADDAVSWHAASPFVRVVALDGGSSRILVQLPASGAEPLRVASWRAERPTFRAALAALTAAIDVGRDAGAATVRVQTAQAGAGLRRAAALLGFVPRRDLTTLWVRSADSALARPDAVVATPWLYLGF